MSRDTDTLAVALGRPEPDLLRHIRWFEDFVDPSTGVVRTLEEVHDYAHGEPAFVYFRSELAPTTGMSDGGYEYLPANGARGLIRELARAKALMEALERYALSLYRKQDLRVESWRSARERGPATDPASFLDHEASTQLRDEVRRAPLPWLAATTGGDDEVLVPAQLVYLPYRFESGEPRLREPLTTGAAAGLSYAAAVRRGLCEVLERDATMIGHYRGSNVRRIAESALTDGVTRSMLAELRACDLDVEIFDFTTDLALPVVVARITSAADEGPATTLGSCASLDVIEAVRSSILEAACFRRPMRERMPSLRSRAEPCLRDWSAVTSLARRAALWVQPQMRDALTYLDDAPLTTSLPRPPAAGFREVLNRIDQLGEPGIIIANVTPPSLRSAFVHVVKVIVPTLQPMHLSEPEATWTKRLIHYSTMGNQPRNPVPHPFL